MSRAVSRKSALIRFLDEVKWPVYLIDRTRQIIFCNQSLADLSGRSVDEMIGRCLWLPLTIASGQRRVRTMSARIGI